MKAVIVSPTAARRPKPGEFQLYQELVGLRFTEIEIHATVNDVANPYFGEWLREALMPRCANPLVPVTIVINGARRDTLTPEEHPMRTARRCETCAGRGVVDDGYMGWFASPNQECPNCGGTGVIQ